MAKKVANTQDEHSNHYKDAIDEILALVKGRAPIIWVTTHEEKRFIDEFRERVAVPTKRQIWTWSAYQGLVPEEEMGITPASGDNKDTHVAKKALERISQMPKAKRPEKGICYIMRDMHIVLAENIVRQLRDMYHYLIGQGKQLIVVSPVLAHGPGGNHQGIPPTMEKEIPVVNYELPNFDQIRQRIEDVVTQTVRCSKDKDKSVNLDYSAEDLNSFAKALRGLTMVEVDSAIATSLTHMKGLRVQKLINEKKQIIARSDILEFVNTDVELGDVGGLDLAKHYLQKYSKAQSDEARDFGVEPLKGVILTGIPGTGKSLFSKVIGKMWGLPLLRLDVGRVMTGLVGGSEGKMREVIKLVKCMRPCVLWIDEVEKSLSGTKSSNFSDGGTLSRVFGTLLHAMQEELDGVTIIATSNDISALPPEFIRRFNDVFFVDLPGPEERWDIFNIHLAKRKRDITKFAKYKQLLLDASEDYTGAEIEKAIKDAIAAAFDADHKDVNYKDILTALSDTKPISKVMRDKITKIRDRARGNYRYASTWAEECNKSRKITGKGGTKLDVNEALDDLPEIKSQKQKVKEEKAGQEDRFSAVANED